MELKSDYNNEKKHAARHIGMCSVRIPSCLYIYRNLSFSQLTKYKINHVNRPKALHLQLIKKRANMKGTKGSETKTLIREAAFKLFLTYDYNVVPLKQIEQKVKVTRGCMTYHYPNKLELFIDVINHYVLHKQDIEQKAPDISHKSLYVFLKYYVDKVGLNKSELSVFLEDKSGTNITRAYLNLIAQAQRYYPDFDKIAYEIKTKEVFVWKNIVERAQERGEIRNDLDSLLLAKQFRYLCYGQSYDDALEHGLNVEKMEEQLLFLYSIIKK